MELQQKNPFIPYDRVPAGFEAVYSGELSATPLSPDGWPISRFTDDQCRVILQWSVWPWTRNPAGWDADIIHINDIQTALGPLDPAARQVRAQIGSLILCDAGIPVTIDDLLTAIGRGGFLDPPFVAGCWPAPLGLEVRNTQAGQAEAFAQIEQVLRGYLAGQKAEQLAQLAPAASGFIYRVFPWLPPLSQLTPLQHLLFERLLLPFDFFTGRNRDDAVLVEDYYGENGRGADLDRKIGAAAGLPQIYANYRPEFLETLQSIQSETQQELYRICGMLAHGLHTLSDCHHSSLRWIEQWVHAVAALKIGIPGRIVGTERTRLARLLFGYTLGLDRWLAGQSLQFLLLELGYIDLGCELRDELQRVYTYLGPERTPHKRWLAACLWKILSGAGNPRALDDPHGFMVQADLAGRARAEGIHSNTWLVSDG
jgi:hypothetical protein